MSKRVLVHVGTPKTGTSALQDVLFRSRQSLAEHGMHYPGDRFDAHFLAALDLMRLPWGGLEEEARGAWGRLAEEVRAAEGTSIISHEILARASRVQVAAALSSFGEAEVHILVSARDLVRQIPAEWQENVKHRRALPYAEFLRRIQDPDRRGALAAWFWGVQEVPDILDRWGSTLPPERVHVITVPPPVAPPGLLWERFVAAFGLQQAPLDLSGERANPSLGVPETALLRRVNRRVNATLDPEHYRPLVRELLAHQTLSRRTTSPRLALPPEVYPWVAERSEAWIEELRRRGYDVVGDLEDLRGVPPERYADPDHPAQRAVAAAAVDAIAALLTEAARLREVEARLTRERDEAVARAQTSRARLTAERVVRGMRREPVGRTLLRGYRFVRGRSSRSA